MKTKLFLICFIMAACFSLFAAEICTRYGTESLNNDEYVIQNNVWGATTAQCIEAAGTGFRVTQSAHNISTSGSPAAYPSIYKGCHWTDCTTNSGMPIQVSQIQNATINWNTTLGSSGAYNVTTEAWFKTNNTPGEPDGAELMIWINHSGSVQPGGSQIGTANLGGYSWQVWYASIGWNFITYKITTPLSSINVDYKPFIQDAISRGYIQNSWYMMDIEAGFEIWNGGVGLTVNSFSAAINGGSIPTPTRTNPPTPTLTPTAQQNRGDVNSDGSVTIVDALMTAQYVVGLNPSNFNSSRADVNCDGNVTIVDALMIAQYYVGIINRFC